MSEFKMSAAERQWMTELNRLGAAMGLEGFPMDAKTFEWNCFLEDYRAGLTAHEAIEKQASSAETRKRIELQNLPCLKHNFTAHYDCSEQHIELPASKFLGFPAFRRTRSSTVMSSRRIW